MLKFKKLITVVIASSAIAGSFAMAATTAAPAASTATMVTTTVTSSASAASNAGSAVAGKDADCACVAPHVYSQLHRDIKEHVHMTLVQHRAEFEKQMNARHVLETRQLALMDEAIALHKRGNETKVERMALHAKMDALFQDLKAERRSEFKMHQLERMEHESFRSHIEAD